MNPPFLFFAKKRNGPFTVQRETAWGLKHDPFQGHVWAEMRGPQQETSAVEASVSVGRDFDFSVTYSHTPRDAPFPCIEVQT